MLLEDRPYTFLCLILPDLAMGTPRPVPSISLLRSLAHAVQPLSHAPPNAALPLCCTRRSLSSTTLRRDDAAKPTPTPPSAPKAHEPKTPEWRHQRYRDGELIPKPLSRPLGLPHAPQAGENTGRDMRSWSEKRADYASYEKHIQRRRGLMEDMLERNYYRDIGNLGKVHKGKSILAPATPFRAQLALYFPNLTGIPLDKSAGMFSGKDVDTTPALAGKVTVLSMINTEWANEQVASFVSKTENTILHAMLDEYAPAKDVVQFATINVEENPLKEWMIRLFWGRLRKQMPKEQWPLYWLNRRGLSNEIRDALGMWNSKVGYVFLLDGKCRVRWAGNGIARDEEKKSLQVCVKRLVDEASGTAKVVLRKEPKAAGDVQSQMSPDRNVTHA